MRVEDKKINELLEKTQNYRKDLASSIMLCSDFESLDLKELEDIFQSNVDIEDKRNICIEYPITRKEATVGSTKEIKYNRINEKGRSKYNYSEDFKGNTRQC